MWLRLPWFLTLAAALCFVATSRPLQDSLPPRSDPQYDDTFSGPVTQYSGDRITVSRSILGKPPEEKSFLIKQDTKVEGKLKLKVRVTVGFTTTEEGDVARLIVVRSGHN